MSNELIAILSLGVSSLGVVAACSALMLTQIRNLRADLTKRLDSQAFEIGEIKREVHGLGERMAHLDGLVEGLKEAVVARVAA